MSAANKDIMNLADNGQGLAMSLSETAAMIRPGPESVFGESPRRSASAARGAHPEGMILALALVLMILVSLMGALILTSARTEVSISGLNRIGREAFNAADSSARIATLLGRILLHPELGPPRQVLSDQAGPKFPLTVEINDHRFNLGALQEESAVFNYNRRYEEAIAYDQGAFPEPHLVFKVQNKVVATAVLSLESDSPLGAGASTGVGDSYDTGGGNALAVNLIVTVNGSPATSSQEGAGDPHSIITAIFREYM